MRALLATVLLLLTALAVADGVIPSHLIGIWATDNSVLRDGLLFEGGALYLGADGVGAMVGGPPPIGARIVATYDSETNTINFQITERGKVIGTGKASYDPVQRAIRSDHGEVFRRKSEKLPNTVRKALGLEPEYERL